MKRLLVLLLCLGLVACGRKDKGIGIKPGGVSSEANREVDHTDGYGSVFRCGRNFSSGVAWVKGLNYPNDTDDKWYIVNTKGDYLGNSNGITPKTDFFNDVAWLSDDTLINTKGEIIATPESKGYTEILDLNERTGYSTVKYYNNDFNGEVSKIGILDNEGNYILNLTDDIEEIELCAEYIFYVRKADDGGDVEIYFDASAKEFISLQTAEVRAFNRAFNNPTMEGLVYFGGEHFSYFHEHIGTPNKFQNGKSTEVTKLGFYDSEGNLVIDLSKYDAEYCSIETDGFINGKCVLYLTKSNGDFYVTIDRNGEFSYEPIKASMYSDVDVQTGIISVKNDDNTYDYIDTNGKTIGENRALEADYRDGIMLVGSDGYNWLQECDHQYVDLDWKPAF